MGRGKTVAGLVLGVGSVYVVALGQIAEWLKEGAWYFAAPFLALMIWSMWSFAQVDSALVGAMQTLRKHGLKGNLP